jgi:hypothetical protein
MVIIYPHSKAIDSSVSQAADVAAAPHAIFSLQLPGSPPGLGQNSCNTKKEQYYKGFF